MRPTPWPHFFRSIRDLVQEFSAGMSHELGILLAGFEYQRSAAFVAIHGQDDVAALADVVEVDRAKPPARAKRLSK